MIEAEKFRELWADKLVKLALPPVDARGVPLEAVRFLTDVGLPDSCAPFLSFDDLARGLQRIYEAYGVTFMPGEPKEENTQRLSPYWIIGSDGEGSPICLDASNQGQVVLLDHEDFFRSVKFINTGISELAECLLAYRDLVEEAQAQNGEDAFLDGNIPEAIKLKTSLTIQRTDPQAWTPGNFWRQEMDNIE